jgi:hypothetical protein
MVEAGVSQDFNAKSHREVDFAHMAKAVRFVPYQLSRMEEYFPSALIDPATIYISNILGLLLIIT